MSRSLHSLFVGGAVALLLAACAAQPVYDSHPGARLPTPSQAATSPMTAHGRSVEWGGTVIDVQNLADRTEIQVLGYPLERSGRPDLTAAPHGRFLVVQSGFLEPKDYAPGRQLTVYGRLEGIVQGRIGDATYAYPRVLASQLQLWPTSGQGPLPSNVQFGIGIGIGL